MEIIASLLAEWGYQVHAGISGHGGAQLVVALQTIVSRNTIRSKRRSSPDGKGRGQRLRLEATSAASAAPVPSPTMPL